jgi:hypothetical protein
MHKDALEPLLHWHSITKRAAWRHSEILSGKRSISKAQAKQLAELIRVPVDLFL